MGVQKGPSAQADRMIRAPRVGRFQAAVHTPADGCDREDGQTQNGEEQGSRGDEGDHHTTVSRLVMTTSRYPLGTIIVPSSARLNRSMSASRSASSAAEPDGPTASNAFIVGP